MDRHVPLEGAQNFRDTGGYETASGASRALADAVPHRLARRCDAG